VGTIIEWLSSISKEIHILASNFENIFSNMLSEKIHDRKSNLTKKLYELENNLGRSSENTNNSLEKHAPNLQKTEEEMMLNNLIMELVKDYSNLTLNYQKELEKTNRLQHDYYNAIRKKDFEISRLKIELTRVTSDLRAKRLALELADWNAKIKLLQAKVESLDAQLSQSHLKSHEEGQLLEKLQKEIQNPIVLDDGVVLDDENKMGNEIDLKDKRSTPEVQDESTNEGWQDIRKEFMNAVREIGFEQKRASHNNKNIEK